MSKHNFKKGDMVKVYGPITDNKETFIYVGAIAKVTDVSWKDSLYVRFYRLHGTLKEKGPHQVHPKQCRKIKVKK